MLRAFRYFSLAVVLHAVAACAPALSPGARAPADWDAAHSEILALLRASSDAWNAADLKGHLALYVDTVTFMTANGPRPGVAPVEEAFSRTYWRDGRPIQRLGFEQVVVRPLSEDAALQTGRFLLTGGGEPDRSGWFTLVWVRTPDGWRAVHDHSS
jgi:beta-aspartyl-peptidase (threonine type)